MQHLPQQGDVGDGQAQGVDLGEALLVRKGGHVATQLFKGRVDGGAAGEKIILQKFNMG